MRGFAEYWLRVIRPRRPDLKPPIIALIAAKSKPANLGSQRGKPRSDLGISIVLAERIGGRGVRCDRPQ
jgi:hypothetical protein